MKKWIPYITMAGVLLALVYGAFLLHRWVNRNQGSILPSAPVIEHDVKTSVSVKAKDKKALKKKGVIPSVVAQDGSKEVTATGTKKDSTGTTHVSAVLDTNTGESVIVQQRSMAEFMKSNAVGIEVELNSHGVSKTLYYDRSIVRVWDFYVSGGPGIRNREDAVTEWLIRAKAELRF
jgi:hypothetical protein